MRRTPRPQYSKEGTTHGVDEWEQLKAVAAEQHTSLRQLNELQTGGGAGGRVLSSTAFQHLD